MCIRDSLYPDPYNLVIFPDNHDMTRFYTQVNNDLDLFNMGIVYFATMRGIPQFFYRTEILMNSNKSPGNHGLIRSNFPCGFPGDKINAFTETFESANFEINSVTPDIYSRRIFMDTPGVDIVDIGRLGKNKIIYYDDENIIKQPLTLFK